MPARAMRSKEQHIICMGAARRGKKAHTVTGRRSAKQVKRDQMIEAHNRNTAVRGQHVIPTDDGPQKTSNSDKLLMSTRCRNSSPPLKSCLCKHIRLVGVCSSISLRISQASHLLWQTIGNLIIVRTND